MMVKHVAPIIGKQELNHELLQKARSLSASRIYLPETPLCVNEARKESGDGDDVDN